MSFSATILTTGPEQTQEAGRAIGEQAQAGDIFLLTGPLGAGKTCFTQGIAGGLGVSGYVRSPTFVLTTRYQGRLTLHHMDLYRIGGPEEAWDLGLDEQLFGGGICIVEWAERAAEIFPPESLWTELEHVDSGDQRSISFIDWPARYRAVLEQLSAAFPAPPLNKEVSS
jgi:tRNA threonylcarbamoyladenosine biosynthesis protein TsaE